MINNDMTKFDYLHLHNRNDMLFFSLSFLSIHTNIMTLSLFIQLAFHHDVIHRSAPLF